MIGAWCTEEQDREANELMHLVGQIFVKPLSLLTYVNGQSVLCPIFGTGGVLEVKDEIVPVTYEVLCGRFQNACLTSPYDVLAAADNLDELLVNLFGYTLTTLRLFA